MTRRIQYGIRIVTLKGLIGSVNKVTVLGRVKKQFIENPPEPAMLAELLSQLRQLENEYPGGERSISNIINNNRTSLDIIRSNSV